MGRKAWSGMPPEARRVLSKRMKCYAGRLPRGVALSQLCFEGPVEQLNRIGRLAAGDLCRFGRVVARAAGLLGCGSAMERDGLRAKESHVGRRRA